jgi:hypothetical protein
MSRIDVLPVREVKGEYKILVNFIQFGIIYHSSQFANQEARNLLQTYPKAELNLVIEEETK